MSRRQLQSVCDKLAAQGMKLLWHKDDVGYEFEAHENGNIVAWGWTAGSPADLLDEVTRHPVIAARLGRAA